jgi:hypothetical protein
MKFKLITQIDRINYLSDNFIKYYKRFFNPDEFRFIIHDVNNLKIRQYLYSHGFTNDEMENYIIHSFGGGENVNRQNEIKTRYINQGYVVIYADMDERIFHPDLRNYIINNLTNWIVPIGISLMQHSSELPFDESKDVLEQRSYGKPDTYWFSKTCILKKDFNWLPGRHIKACEKDPNIYLIDIGKMCKDFMLRNNEESRKIYKSLVWKYSTNDKRMFDKVFSEHANPIERLPEIIKNSNLF